MKTQEKKDSIYILRFAHRQFITVPLQQFLTLPSCKFLSGMVFRAWEGNIYLSKDKDYRRIWGKYFLF